MLGHILTLGSLALGAILLGKSLTAVLQGGILAVFLFAFLGAWLARCSFADILSALGGQFAAAARALPASGAIEEMVLHLATRVRHEGLLALDAEVENQKFLPLKRGLKSLLDGQDAAGLRGLLRAEKEAFLASGNRASAVLEAAADLCTLTGVGLAVFWLALTLPALEGGASGGAAALSEVLMAFFYGLFFSEWVFRPRARAVADEVEKANLLFAELEEGMLGLQQGIAPAALKHRLESESRLVAAVSG